MHSRICLSDDYGKCFPHFTISKPQKLWQILSWISVEVGMERTIGHLQCYSCWLTKFHNFSLLLTLIFYHVCKKPHIYAALSLTAVQCNRLNTQSGLQCCALAAFIYNWSNVIVLSSCLGVLQSTYWDHNWAFVGIRHIIRPYFIFCWYKRYFGPICHVMLVEDIFGSQFAIWMWVVVQCLAKTTGHLSFGDMKVQIHIYKYLTLTFTYVSMLY